AAEPERVGARRAAVHALGTEGVVATALVRVGQHLVGVGDLLEAGLGLGIPVSGVRVQLARELAKGALDLVRGGVAGHAEQLVVVGSGSHGSLSQPSVRRSDRRSLTTATAASACG